jgi:uncharacterized protein YjdB
MITPITFRARARARAGLPAALGLCTLLVTACGGGGDTTAPPPSPLPPPPSLTGISVTPAAVTLTGLTSTAALTATLQPAGIAAAITWTSEQPAIATVVASGNGATVTAVAGGTARIVARAGTFEAATTVTVVPLLRTLTVPPDTIRLAPGGTQRLVPTLGKDAGADTSLAYTSSAPAIATVDSVGVISAVAPGTALITVQSVAVPALTAVAPIRVALPTVGVQVTPVNPTVLTGATLQLSATVTAPVGVSTSVTWSSSTAAVATVNGAGLVTAVAPGTAMIVATSTANPVHRDSTRVLVRAPTVRGITLTPQTAVLFPGSTRPLVATLDADTGANDALVWTSSDAAIASVSQTGVVTGVALGGPVSITARSVLVPSVSASVQVTVSAPPPATQFTFGRLGSGLSLGGIGTYNMATVDATHAIVGLGYVAPGGVLFVNQVLLRSANGWRNISPACCSTQGYALVSAGSATDMLVAYTGAPLTVTDRSKRVFRWNGTSLVDTDYPAALATNVSVPIGAVKSTGNGEHLVLHRSGLLYRYGTGGWTRVDSLASGTGFPSFGAFVAWHRDSLLAFSCPGGTNNRLVEYANGTQRVLPAPPGECRGFSGQSRSVLTQASADGLSLWNGTNWTLITNGLQSDDVLWTSATCGAERYAAARNGNIYRLQSGTMVRIATNGEAVAQGEFTTVPVLDCAPDGTLRVASGDALIARRAGSGWVEENYAPPAQRRASVG